MQQNELKEKIKSELAKIKADGKKLDAKIKLDFMEFDDFREEKIDTFIANDILKTADENTSLDELEKKGVEAGCKFANVYLVKYHLPTLSADAQEKIADAVVKGISKANKFLQKELNKKSKAYLKRHSSQKTF
jgi:hypothetical protein